MIISPTRLTQHKRVLRELEGIQAKFQFQKCVLRTPAVLESVLGKSSPIWVCLSESWMTSFTLCYWGEIILYCFRIFFPVSENIALFFQALTRLVPRGTYKLIHIVFHSHIISIFFCLCPHPTQNFVTKIFRYRSFPIITGHGTDKVLLMNSKSQGLG